MFQNNNAIYAASTMAVDVTAPMDTIGSFCKSCTYELILILKAIIWGKEFATGINYIVLLS